MDYRLEEMWELKQAGTTCQEIAGRFGISRQRVQQIMAPSLEVKQLVRAKAEGKCQQCGEYILISGHFHHKDMNNVEYLCPSCHMKEHHHTMSDETRMKISEAVMEARYKKYLATGLLDGIKVKV